jgi:hemerythrin-like domain-containing protein
MAAAHRLTLIARSAGDPVPDITSMVVIHRAIRRDLARLAPLAGTICDGELQPGQASALHHYTRALLAAIRAHLDNEDAIIWPVIAATARQAVDLTPLTDDHQAIRAAASQVSHALACFAAQPDRYAAALRTSVSMLRDLLDEHICDEEAQLFPTMSRYLPANAYRWCEKQVYRTAALSDLKFTLPWLARHARQDEVRGLLAAGGWPARIIQAAARPRYRRLERRAFGAGREPRIPTHERHCHERNAGTDPCFPASRCGPAVSDRPGRGAGRRDPQ